MTLRPLLLAAALALAAGVAPARSAETALEPCRLKGISREARCGTVQRPENPDAPDGRKIAIKFAVVPALAKNKAPDPVFVFAGGPGQGATQIAKQVLATQAQLNARRDIVFVDQRGTGESNKLGCPPPAGVPTVAEAIDSRTAFERLERCFKKLADQGNDTRQYATWIAMRDLDAVRAALGAEKINLWGGSYGTRAALEYLRQFPARVRSVVLDGVAPADMVLPTSFAVDNDAALKQMVARCEQDARCRSLHPKLATDIDRLFADADAGRLRATVAHPLTGRRETVTLDRDTIAGTLRAPLYVPMFAAALPHAIARASAGEPDALITLTMAFAGSASETMAELMHFAVVCAEDMPRLDEAALAAARGTRFGNSFDAVYRRVCANVAVRPVPPEFYITSDADVPVLILSGGADPATPPRHGEAIAKRLKNARHFVAPNLGHGVASHGCAPELITKFIRQANFEAIDGACLAKLPAPTVFFAPGAIAEAGK
jgi:pimeloyl-ACP methyl ester carboxylesterase